MNNIEVISTQNEVALFLEEALSSKVQHMWKNYGASFYAFRHTDSLRLIGPLESDGAGKMESTLRNNQDVIDLTDGLFPRTVDWLQQNFLYLQRAALIKLYPNKEVTRHVDRGDYFDKTQRFHLCLSGSYRYFVGDESLDVVPGTLFTFCNSVLHGTQNLTSKDRITLMFDVLRVSKPL